MSFKKICEIITPDFLKSEFNIDLNYLDVFKNHGFFPGRLICASKSGYYDKHPNNLIVFNSNVITKKSGKVWYGDLDVTLDFDNLKNVADELNEDLYILREMDARFENENKSFNFYKEKAITVIKCKNNEKFY